jgi:hypothetical protein
VLDTSNMRHRRAVAVLGTVLGLVSGCAEVPTFDDDGFDTARCPMLGDPVLCGGCDPRCFIIHDAPTGRDLTDENGSLGTSHPRFTVRAETSSR